MPAVRVACHEDPFVVTSWFRQWCINPLLIFIETTIPQAKSRIRERVY